MDLQLFDLPEARQVWQTMRRRLAIALVGAECPLFLGAAAIAILSPHAFAVRLELTGIILLLAVATSAYGVYRYRRISVPRTPTTLVLDGARLEVRSAGGPLTSARVADPGFRVDLWTWPRAGGQGPRYTVDLGELRAVPVGEAAVNSMTTAFQEMNLRRSELEYRLPFPDRKVRRITWRAP